jgi:hypothetical protein
MIFAYMSFFRLEELSIDDYKKLVMSQDAVKMHTFLQFVFNADGLRDHVRAAWMDLYDYQYIDDKIIGGVEKNLPNVSDILRSLEKKATGKVQSTLSMSQKSTEMETDDQSFITTQQQSIAGGIGDDSEAPKKITVQ